jgi:hypothetical protein
LHSSLTIPCVWFGFVLFFSSKVVQQECSNFKGEKFVFYGFEFLNKLICFFCMGCFGRNVQGEFVRWF